MDRTRSYISPECVVIEFGTAGSMMEQIIEGSDQPWDTNAVQDGGEAFPGVSMFDF